MAFKITKVTAFIATDRDGTEGVMAAMIGNTWTPLICADEARIKSMYPIARKISEMSGQQYRVLQFSVREDITDQIHKEYGDE